MTGFPLPEIAGPGILIVQREYVTPALLQPGRIRVGVDEYMLVVTRADKHVSASASLLAECERGGLLVGGVLTIGTVGRALGVVRYRVGPAASAAYRAMTRLEDE